MRGEAGTPEQKVAGSNPARRTISFNRLAGFGSLKEYQLVPLDTVSAPQRVLFHFFSSILTTRLAARRFLSPTACV
jgi:hypothetical protein